MENKSHLTKEGLEKIKLIKMYMNKGRTRSSRPENPENASAISDGSGDTFTGSLICRQHVSLATVSPYSREASSLFERIRSMENGDLKFWLIVLVIGVIELMQQTICREFKNCYNNSLLQNTINVRSIIYSFIVTIFVILNNPQITKARSGNFKSSFIYK